MGHKPVANISLYYSGGQKRITKSQTFEKLNQNLAKLQQALESRLFHIFNNLTFGPILFWFLTLGLFYFDSLAVNDLHQVPMPL